MNAVKILGLKVDVDTLRGYREGVPNLLGLLEELSVKASFFFSMGPDNSGKALVRVFRPGFLEKMRRTSAVSTYGWRTLLYGTLLPAPLIVESAPGIKDGEKLRRAFAAVRDFDARQDEMRREQTERRERGEVS